jgi:transcriptional regulator with XRE-family HTH domain
LREIIREKKGRRGEIVPVNENIKARRLFLKMKQAELAKHIGISQNHLSQLERGTRKVSLSLLDKFAQALDMIPADLLRDYYPEPFDSDLGQVIKWMRATRGIPIEDFASAIQESPETVKKWEQKEGSMDSVATDKLSLIAKALNTSVDYLVGATEDASSEETGTWLPPPLRNEIAAACVCPTDCELIKIPVLSIKKPGADSGNGVSIEDVGLTIERWECVSREDLGPIDVAHGPFIVRMNGDSMDGAEIHNGDKLIINPVAEVQDGSPALVCYGAKHEYAIKWVYWETDGGMTIRSANPRYQSRAFNREEISQGFFRLVGKVVQVTAKPLNG